MATTHLFPRPRWTHRLRVEIRHLRRKGRAGQLTEAPRGIQPREHTGSKKGRRELEEPTVILQSNNASETETVKGPADVPVPSDSGSIGTNELEKKSTG